MIGTVVVNLWIAFIEIAECSRYLHFSVAFNSKSLRRFGCVIEFFSPSSNNSSRFWWKWYTYQTVEWKSECIFCLSCANKSYLQTSTSIFRSRCIFHRLIYCLSFIFLARLFLSNSSLPSFNTVFLIRQCGIRAFDESVSFSQVKSLRPVVE